MDLSSIPLEVLRAEHEAVDNIDCPIKFLLPTPVCDYMHHIGQSCSGDGCAAVDNCDLMLDESSGWPERKERYLQAIRAEIKRRP